jgi:sugar phosphate isomerase/epimerase
MLSKTAVHVFHMNDYPAMPPRAAIKDSDRVYPGDGIAPLPEVFETLREIGYEGFLSIELFNPTYWQQDPLTVARTALDKLKAIAEAKA